MTAAVRMALSTGSGDDWEHHAGVGAGLGEEASLDEPGLGRR